MQKTQRPLTAAIKTYDNKRTELHLYNFPLPLVYPIHFVRFPQYTPQFFHSPSAEGGARRTPRVRRMFCLLAAGTLGERSPQNLL